jgi:hypothetical protein
MRGRWAGWIALGTASLLWDVATAAPQTTAAPAPPEPPAAADLSALAQWIGRWLPVVGAATYSAIEDTGDFLARASDSVTAAGLQGCTLVLHQRSTTTVNAGRSELRRTIRVPLAQVDTGAVQPKVRRPRMLLGGETVMLTGQMVVPLRSQLRDRFIAVATEEEPTRDTLVAEHLVPFPFAIVPASRAAQAIRQAATLCAAHDSLLFHQLHPPVLRPPFLGVVRRDRSQGAGPGGF